MRRRYGINDTVGQRFSTRGNHIITTSSEQASSSLFSPPSSENVELTRSQIYETAFLLRQKLPPELIPEILEYAEYWLQTSFSSEADVYVSEDDENEGTLRYLSTEPIGLDRLSGLRPVRKVVFEVCSKDQGWSSFPGDHGSYRESWTWFEVKVREDRGAGEEIGEDVGRMLTRNIHASKEYHTHVITWAAKSENEDEARWVRDLRRGQIIELTAHAKYPMWTNHVRHAVIDVYTAAIR